MPAAEDAAGKLLFGARRWKLGSWLRLITPSRLDGTGGAPSSLHTQLGQQPLCEYDVADYEENDPSPVWQNLSPETLLLTAEEDLDHKVTLWRATAASVLLLDA